MNNRIERIKKHFSDNKKIYISAGIGLAVGAVTTLLITQKYGKVKVTQQATNNAVVNWKPSIVQEQTTIVMMETRGRPANPVICNQTKEVWKSQQLTAAANAVSEAALSRHLNGNKDSVNGRTYTRLITA